MTIEFFKVGGFVRDTLAGLPSHDVDFTVIAPSFEAMREELARQGFTEWQVREEFGTVRCGVPKGHALREHTKDADFVMARRDGPSTDGRRPDFVEAGTLLDDLQRRDFTVNAIAMAVDGTIVDPFRGREDLAAGILRFVGNPADRIAEDGLRVMRAFRFMITKGFTFSATTHVALFSDLAVEMMAKIPQERIGMELDKMFAADTVATLEMLTNFMRRDMVEQMFERRGNHAHPFRLGATFSEVK